MGHTFISRTALSAKSSPTFTSPVGTFQKPPFFIAAGPDDAKEAATNLVGIARVESCEHATRVLYTRLRSSSCSSSLGTSSLACSVAHAAAG